MTRSSRTSLKASKTTDDKKSNVAQNFLIKSKRKSCKTKVPKVNNLKPQSDENSVVCSEDSKDREDATTGKRRSLDDSGSKLSKRKQPRLERKSTLKNLTATELDNIDVFPLKHITKKTPIFCTKKISNLSKNHISLTPINKSRKLSQSGFIKSLNKSALQTKNIKSSYENVSDLPIVIENENISKSTHKLQKCSPEKVRRKQANKNKFKTNANRKSKLFKTEKHKNTNFSTSNEKTQTSECVQVSYCNESSIENKGDENASFNALTKHENASFNALTEVIEKSDIVDNICENYISTETSLPVTKSEPKKSRRDMKTSRKRTKKEQPTEKLCPKISDRTATDFDEKCVNKNYNRNKKASENSNLAETRVQTSFKETTKDILEKPRKACILTMTKTVKTNRKRLNPNNRNGKITDLEKSSVTEKSPSIDGYEKSEELSSDIMQNKDLLNLNGKESCSVANDSKISYQIFENAKKSCLQNIPKWKRIKKNKCENKMSNTAIRTKENEYKNTQSLTLVTETAGNGENSDLSNLTSNYSDDLVKSANCENTIKDTLKDSESSESDMEKPNTNMSSISKNAHDNFDIKMQTPSPITKFENSCDKLKKERNTKSKRTKKEPLFRESLPKTASILSDSRVFYGFDTFDVNYEKVIAVKNELLKEEAMMFSDTGSEAEFDKEYSVKLNMNLDSESLDSCKKINTKCIMENVNNCCHSFSKGNLNKMDGLNIGELNFIFNSNRNKEADKFNSCTQDTYQEERSLENFTDTVESLINLPTLRSKTRRVSSENIDEKEEKPKSQPRRKSLSALISKMPKCVPIEINSVSENISSSKMDVSNVCETPSKSISATSSIKSKINKNSKGKKRKSSDMPQNVKEISNKEDNYPILRPRKRLCSSNENSSNLCSSKPLIIENKENVLNENSCLEKCSFDQICLSALNLPESELNPVESKSRVPLLKNLAESDYKSEVERKEDTESKISSLGPIVSNDLINSGHLMRQQNVHENSFLLSKNSSQAPSESSHGNFSNLTLTQNISSIKNEKDSNDNKSLKFETGVSSNKTEQVLNINYESVEKLALGEGESFEKEAAEKFSTDNNICGFKSHSGQWNKSSENIRKLLPDVQLSASSSVTVKIEDSVDGNVKIEKENTSDDLHERFSDHSKSEEIFNEKEETKNKCKIVQPIRRKRKSKKRKLETVKTIAEIVDLNQLSLKRRSDRLASKTSLGIFYSGDDDNFDLFVSDSDEPKNQNRSKRHTLEVRFKLPIKECRDIRSKFKSKGRDINANTDFSHAENYQSKKNRTINYECDGAVFLSQDGILFKEALFRPGSDKKIYHIFEYTGDSKKFETVQENNPAEESFEKVEGINDNLDLNILGNNKINSSTFNDEVVTPVEKPCDKKFDPTMESISENVDIYNLDNKSNTNDLNVVSEYFSNKNFGKLFITPNISAENLSKNREILQDSPNPKDEVYEILDANLSNCFSKNLTGEKTAFNCSNSNKTLEISEIKIIKNVEQVLEDYCDNDSLSSKVPELKVEKTIEQGIVEDCYQNECESLETLEIKNGKSHIEELAVENDCNNYKLSSDIKTEVDSDIEMLDEKKSCQKGQKNSTSSKALEIKKEEIPLEDLAVENDCNDYKLPNDIKTEGEFDIKNELSKIPSEIKSDTIYLNEQLVHIKKTNDCNLALIPNQQFLENHEIKIENELDLVYDNFVRSDKLENTSSENKLVKNLSSKGHPTPITNLIENISQPAPNAVCAADLLSNSHLRTNITQGSKEKTSENVDTSKGLKIMLSGAVEAELEYVRMKLEVEGVCFDQWCPSIQESGEVVEYDKENSESSESLARMHRRVKNRDCPVIRFFSCAICGYLSTMKRLISNHLKLDHDKGNNGSSLNKYIEECFDSPRILHEELEWQKKNYKQGENLSENLWNNWEGGSWDNASDSMSPWDTDIFDSMKEEARSDCDVISNSLKSYALNNRPDWLTKALRKKVLTKDEILRFKFTLNELVESGYTKKELKMLNFVKEDWFKMKCTKEDFKNLECNKYDLILFNFKSRSDYKALKFKVDDFLDFDFTKFDIRNLKFKPVELQNMGFNPKEIIGNKRKSNFPLVKDNDIFNKEPALIEKILQRTELLEMKEHEKILQRKERLKMEAQKLKERNYEKDFPLNYSVSVKFAEYNISCSECDFKTVSKSFLKSHMAFCHSHHSDKKVTITHIFSRLYHCKKCSFRHPVPRLVREHFEIHPDTINKVEWEQDKMALVLHCVVCSENFDTLSLIKLHFVNQHSNYIGDKISAKIFSQPENSYCYICKSHIKDMDINSHYISHRNSSVPATSSSVPIESGPLNLSVTNKSLASELKKSEDSERSESDGCEEDSSSLSTDLQRKKSKIDSLLKIYYDKFPKNAADDATKDTKKASKFKNNKLGNPSVKTNILMKNKSLKQYVKACRPSSMNVKKEKNLVEFIEKDNSKTYLPLNYTVPSVDDNHTRENILIDFNTNSTGSIESHKITAYSSSQDYPKDSSNEIEVVGTKTVASANKRKLAPKIIPKLYTTTKNKSGPTTDAAITRNDIGLSKSKSKETTLSDVLVQRSNPNAKNLTLILGKDLSLNYKDGVKTSVVSKSKNFWPVTSLAPRGSITENYTPSRESCEKTNSESIGKKFLNSLSRGKFKSSVKVPEVIDLEEERTPISNLKISQISVPTTKESHVIPSSKKRDIVAPNTRIDQIIVPSVKKDQKSTRKKNFEISVSRVQKMPQITVPSVKFQLVIPEVSKSQISVSGTEKTTSLSVSKNSDLLSNTTATRFQNKKEKSTVPRKDRNKSKSFLTLNSAICELCRVSYENHAVLVSHIARIHPKLVNKLSEFTSCYYKCGICKNLEIEKFYTNHQRCNDKSGTDKNLSARCLNYFKEKFMKLLSPTQDGYIHLSYPGCKGHTCIVCGTLYYTEEKLIHHTRVSHIGLKLFQCRHCNFESFERSTMIPHMYFHVGLTPVKNKCNCGYIGRTAALLDLHKIECSVLNRNFDNVLFGSSSNSECSQEKVEINFQKEDKISPYFKDETNNQKIIIQYDASSSNLGNKMEKHKIKFNNGKMLEKQLKNNCKFSTTESSSVGMSTNTVSYLITNPTNVLTSNSSISNPSLRSKPKNSHRYKRYNSSARTYSSRNFSMPRTSFSEQNENTSSDSNLFPKISGQSKSNKTKVNVESFDMEMIVTSKAFATDLTSEKYDTNSLRTKYSSSSNDSRFNYATSEISNEASTSTASNIFSVGESYAPVEFPTTNENVLYTDTSLFTNSIAGSSYCNPETENAETSCSNVQAENPKPEISYYSPVETPQNATYSISGPDSYIVSNYATVADLSTNIVNSLSTISPTLTYNPITNTYDLSNSDQNQSYTYWI